jgi:predicted permease
MSKLLRAFSFAARSLRHERAYFFLCVLLLAFTTAALIVMSALLDALVFRTPSARAPEELTFIQPSSYGATSRPQFFDFRQRNRSFSDIIGFDAVVRVQVRAGARGVERGIQGVSGNFFLALGLPMLRGRGFVDADDRESGPNLVVITEELSRELGVDVGGSVEVNANACTIIGVLPVGYEPLERGLRPQVFIPTGRVAPYRESWLPSNPDVAWIRLAGRLRPGVTEHQALDDLRELSRQWDVSHSFQVETRFQLLPFWRSRLVQDVRSRTALLLTGAVVLLFVLASTNLYGLTQLRWLGRRREVALRLALGATRADIAAWRLGELCGVLVIGVALGAALGQVVTRSLGSDARIGWLIVMIGVRPGWSAVAVTALLGALAVTIVWLLGIARMRDSELLVAIKETASAPRQRRGLVTLLAVELALALGLVVLCLSFAATLSAVSSRHLQFQIEGVYYATAEVRALGWFNDRSRSNAFYQSILDRLLQVPGVKAAGLSNYRPLNGATSVTIEIDGKVHAADGRENLADWAFVSPGYFDALGIHFQSGRNLTRDETDRNEYVAVVNAAFERRFFPDGALGKTFEPFAVAGETPIVGVVSDVPRGLEADVGPAFYLLYTTTTLSVLHFFVRLEPNAPEPWWAVTRTLEKMWPNDTPPRLYASESLIDNSTGDLQTALRVASWIATLAGLVVACGVYFFSAFVTAQSLRDSAMRIALGASLRQLMREHVRHYCRGVYAGLALGALLVLFVFVPMLESLKVPLTAPGVLLVVTGATLLGGVTLVGLCVPLWRLRRLDVVSTLNAE